MDASDYPSLSRLARLNAQLAANSVRVSAIVNAQLDSVERLFRAATAHDWDAIARVSGDLAKQPVDDHNSAVVRSAAKVCESLRRDPSGAKAAGRLATLLSACRTAKARSHAW